MPTYNPVKISAKLTITDLDDTVSDTIQMRMGREQQIDSDRITEALRGGRKLPERALGPQAYRDSALQFLGANGDMPLLMVEVSDCALPEKKNATPGQHASSIGASAGLDLSSPATTTLEQSRLTAANYGASESDTTAISVEKPQPTILLKPFKHPAAQRDPVAVSPSGLSRPKIILKMPKGTIRSSDEGRTLALDNTENGENTDDSPQALSLVVDYANATFGRPSRPNNDLKFEVFLNGDLVDTVYDCCRKAYKFSMNGGTKVFGGTRFHRQAEKPWVYEQYPATANSRAAERRWARIAKNCVQEATSRGQDQHGDIPISAKYLNALSNLAVPDRVREAMGDEFSVIDIIITSGEGRKFGPDTTYIREPSRLGDRRFTVTPSPVPFGRLNDLFRSSMGMADSSSPLQQSTYASKNKGKNPFLIGVSSSKQPAPLSSSPQIPQQRNSKIDPRLSFVNNLPLEQPLTSCLTSHGKHDACTLRQHMGELKEATPKKMQETLETLKAELGEKQILAMTKALAIDGENTAVPDGQTELNVRVKNVRFSDVVDEQVLPGHVRTSDVPKGLADHHGVLSNDGTRMIDPAQLVGPIETASAVAVPVVPPPTATTRIYVTPIVSAPLVCALIDPVLTVEGSPFDNDSNADDSMIVDVPATGPALSTHPHFKPVLVNVALLPEPMISGVEHHGFPTFAPLFDSVDDAFGNHSMTVDPRNLYISPPDLADMTTPNVGEPEVDMQMLTIDEAAREEKKMQKVIDIGLSYGLDPGGHLMRRLDPTLAARMPHWQPLKKQPEPKRRICRPPGSGKMKIAADSTSKRKRHLNPTTPESGSDPEYSVSVHTKPKRTKLTPQTRQTLAKTTAKSPTAPRALINSPGRRTNRVWNTSEQTVLEALEAFEIPSLCVGSAVGYGPGLQQRQVKKERGGTFKEERLVVGMRFVVV